MTKRKRGKALADNVDQVAFALSIWRTTPVAKVPRLQLADWRVIQTECGERHFVGYNLTEREGRVSSRIIDFDAVSRCGRTRTGRVYELVGPPGRHPDAEHTWAWWCRINNMAEATDVTAEYGNAIAAASAVVNALDAHAVSNWPASQASSSTAERAALGTTQQAKGATAGCGSAAMSETPDSVPVPASALARRRAGMRRTAAARARKKSSQG